METKPLFLNTKDAAKFLTDLGYKTAPATLAKMRCWGRAGPEYRLFGRKPLYTEKALSDWARSRTSSPRRSTSEMSEAA
jgi:hypothetical protein